MADSSNQKGMILPLNVRMEEGLEMLWAIIRTQRLLEAANESLAQLLELIGTRLCDRYLDVV